MSDQLNTVNDELKTIVEKYKNDDLYKMMQDYKINPKSKGKMQTLTSIILSKNNCRTVLSFAESKNVQLKNVKLVRGGNVDASLSMPSFDYCEIANEEWETSKLRKLFTETTYLLFYYEWPPYQSNQVYLRAAFAWKIPSQILENGIRQCWQTVSDCVKAGKIVKYIDDKGKYHTYFPRTADNPYIHVRPHAVSIDDMLPLPTPDLLTGLREYPRHSFWINRILLEKQYLNFAEGKR